MSHEVQRADGIFGQMHDNDIEGVEFERIPGVGEEMATELGSVRKVEALFPQVFENTIFQCFESGFWIRPFSLAEHCFLEPWICCEVKQEGQFYSSSKICNI